jgi:hypothetical protein
MEKKLCPFDKKPCIQDACAIYLPASGCCGLIGDQAHAMAVQKERQKEAEKSGGSRYRVDLFD